MKIQLNSDSSIEVSEALTHAVETTLHDAFDRYGDRITRLEVHLSDENSDSGKGIQCLVEARPAGIDPVVVTGSGDAVERACHDAVQKMHSLLDSTFGRIDTRDADATIRHTG